MLKPKKILSLKIQMNLMVISDYGVAEMDDKEDVLLEDYLDLDDVQHIVYTPGYVAITPFALRHDKVIMIQIRATVACVKPVSFSKVTEGFSDSFPSTRG